MIPFNKPYLTGKEAHFIYQAVYGEHISGNGVFSKKCHAFFEERYGFKKALLTTSCTDALEMCAILSGIRPGDEVIVPSFTFVSTALAFVRQGATIVFADSCSDNPNIDADQIEALITARTKAIVPVHYAGVACDMDRIMALSRKYDLMVIEDAAQAIESYHHPLIQLRAGKICFIYDLFNILAKINKGIKRYQINKRSYSIIVFFRIRSDSRPDPLSFDNRLH